MYAEDVVAYKSLKDHPPVRRSAYVYINIYIRVYKYIPNGIFKRSRRAGGKKAYAT